MLADVFRHSLPRFGKLRLGRPAHVPLGRYAAVVTRRGHRLHVMAEDLSITPTLILTGRWEPPVEALLRDLLHPGAQVAEGGANIGYHTLGMAERIGPAGRLHAFEPVPDFLPLLEQSLAINRLAPRVALHGAALLDRPGAVEILQDPLFCGSGHLAMFHSGGRYTRRIPVEAVTLDGVLGARPLDLIRLDIEGSEMLALRGAEGIIRASPRLRIVMEWSPEMLRVRCDPAAEAAWLAALGFRFWRVAKRLHPWRPYRLEEVGAAELPQLPHGELLASRTAP